MKPECYRVDIRFIGASGSTLPLADNLGYGGALLYIKRYVEVMKFYASIYEKRLQFKLQSIDGVRFQLLRIETQRQTRDGRPLPDKAGLCALLIIVNEQPTGTEDYHKMLVEALENAKSAPPLNPQNLVDGNAR